MGKVITYSNNSYIKIKIFVILIICLVLNIFSNQSAMANPTDTLWQESWEGDWTTHWHPDAGTWEVGTPTSGPNGVYVGVKCAATVIGGNYSEGIDTRLIRHNWFVVPPANQNPRLRFWHWFDMKAGDYGEVHIMVQNGSWKTIYSNYANQGSGVWTYPSIDLSPYADSTVQIAFYFHSWNAEPYQDDTGPGWYIDEVAIITGPITFSSPEDFEFGIGDWASERGTWEVGVPDTSFGPRYAHHGQACIGTVLSGNYYEEVDTRFISPKLKIHSIGTNPALQFWHWFSNSAGDFGNVQIKVNNGIWIPISPDFVNTSSGIWTNYYISLSDYADSTVQIAFYFHSHNKEPYQIDIGPGWYIDQISISGDPTGVEENQIGKEYKYFTLLQNYPNPFNPVTKFEYQIPVKSKITLKIYNVLGQLVMSLVDGIENEGYKSVEWNASNVASGVYFYRLEATSVSDPSKTFTQVKKMIYLR